MGNFKNSRLNFKLAFMSYYHPFHHNSRLSWQLPHHLSSRLTHSHPDYICHTVRLGPQIQINRICQIRTHFTEMGDVW